MEASWSDFEWILGRCCPSKSYSRLGKTHVREESHFSSPRGLREQKKAKNDPKRPPKRGPRQLQDDTFSNTNSKTNFDAANGAHRYRGGGGTRVQGGPALETFGERIRENEEEYKGISSGVCYTPTVTSRGGGGSRTPCGRRTAAPLLASLVSIMISTVTEM